MRVMLLSEMLTSGFTKVNVAAAGVNRLQFLLHSSYKTVINVQVWLVFKMFPSTLSLSSNYFNNKVRCCLGAVQNRLPSSDVLQTGAAEMFFTVVITAYKLSVRFITHDADGGG